MPVDSRTPDVVDDHYYSNNPAAFATLADRYDAADRNGPKVLIGEYGVTNGTSTNPPAPCQAPSPRHPSWPPPCAAPTS
jgi:hypothetical protein